MPATNIIRKGSQRGFEILYEFDSNILSETPQAISLRNYDWVDVDFSNKKILKIASGGRIFDFDCEKTEIENVGLASNNTAEQLIVAIGELFNTSNP